jgi:hypothetical protein
MSHSGDPEVPAAPRLAVPEVAGLPEAQCRALTRLPRRVITVTPGAAPANPVAALREGLAGLDAIAAGLASDSDLVRAVVMAIYAESDDGAPPPLGGGERTGEPEALLTECREVTRLLVGRVDPADSAAYRQWVQSVAARVYAARASTDPGRSAGERFGPAEREFLVRLGAALGLGAHA